jgi:hypothetical protein
LLPKYLKEFSVNDDFIAKNIVDDPDISVWKGLGDRAHRFLTSEGVSTCAHCNELMCVHCCEKTVDDRVYCLSCHATHSLIPLAGYNGSKTIAEMRQDLREHFNFDHVDKLPFDEVKEAYNNM